MDPLHPGEILLEEFLKPLGMTQTELAQRIQVSHPRVNKIVKGMRSPHMYADRSNLVGGGVRL